MLVTTLGANLLGNMLADTRVKSKIPKREATIPGLGVIWAGEETFRAGQDF